jgi:predicted ABC-type ATPase
VRSTVVPELSRVTITCRLRESDLAGVQKRLRALVCITFFHITKVRTCVENNELLLRSHALLLAKLPAHETPSTLESLLTECDAELVFGDDNAVIPEDGLSKDETDDIKYDEAFEKNSHGGASSVFIHIANDPAAIDGFMVALRQRGIQIQELQNCGPLFLDTSQSTLDTEMETSFTRRVTQEVEELLMDNAAVEPRPDIHALPKFRIEGLDDEDHDREVARAKQVFVPTSTFQLHANKSGHFTAERLKLHARIAHQLYEATPQNISMPKFVLLIGVPGAGKSTILSHLDTTGQLKLSDFVNFDVDDIISMLPEFYHAMLNVGLGNSAPSSTKQNRRAVPTPQTRYQMCRDEARFILQKNLHSAIMCRRNIILHGTGKSYSQYASLIDQVKSSGFDAHVVCLDIPLEDAYDRVEKRSNGYGRDVPRVLIDFTASLITRNFRRLAARVPNAHLFASDVMPPRLVWSKQEDKIVRSNRSDTVQLKYEL